MSDEFIFILLETDKGIMLRPVREYISVRDMQNNWLTVFLGEE